MVVARPVSRNLGPVCGVKVEASNTLKSHMFIKIEKINVLLF
jgi:hypothetical protein